MNNETLISSRLESARTRGVIRGWWWSEGRRLVVVTPLSGQNKHCRSLSAVEALLAQLGPTGRSNIKQGVR